jgi:hypothetical protein
MNRFISNIIAGERITFIGHARSLDIDAAELVVAFNAFIGQVLSNRKID